MTRDVVVFRSADPEFFIAHADLELIRTLPRTPQPAPTELGFFHALLERWRTLPQITIAEIDGIARGGGSEFALSLDLRFASDRSTLGPARGRARPHPGWRRNPAARSLRRPRPRPRNRPRLRRLRRHDGRRVRMDQPRPARRPSSGLSSTASRSGSPGSRRPRCEPPRSRSTPPRHRSLPGCSTSRPHGTRR